MFNMNHLTAIKRKTLSAPATWLGSQGLLSGRVLDYGCGKGDLVPFSGLPNVSQYDPYYFPECPTGKFDTIYCGYVLNVLEPLARYNTILSVKVKLAKYGRAYFAVRRDIKKEGRTKRGTTQYNVSLDEMVGITLLHQTKSFAIYRLCVGGA